jgi:hypothetical protein
MCKKPTSLSSLSRTATALAEHAFCVAKVIWKSSIQLGKNKKELLMRNRTKIRKKSVAIYENVRVSTGIIRSIYTTNVSWNPLRLKEYFNRADLKQNGNKNKGKINVSTIPFVLYSNRKVYSIDIISK